jgi:hypothetical protein
MRRFIIAVLLTILTAAGVAWADEIPTPPAVVAAKQKHDTTISTAKETYYQAIIAADQQYVAELDAALKQAMINQDIDLARAVDDQKKAAQAVLKEHQANAASRDATFRITRGEYGPQDDIEAAVRREFGDAYRVTDWQDVKAQERNITAWIQSVGLPLREYVTVTFNHQRNWGNRYYFLCRFDGANPGDFLAHDNIANGTILLGSWMGNHHVLAVRK